MCVFSNNHEEKCPYNKLQTGLHLAKLKHRDLFNAFPLNVTSIRKLHRIRAGPWGFITVHISIPYSVLLTPTGIPISTAALAFIPSRIALLSTARSIFHYLFSYRTALVHVSCLVSCDISISNGFNMSDLLSLTRALSSSTGACRRSHDSIEIYFQHMG